MILIVGPAVIIVGALLIVAPRLAWLGIKLAFALCLLVVIYVVDGQAAHPWLPHAQPKSAAVR